MINYSKGAQNRIIIVLLVGVFLVAGFLVLRFLREPQVFVQEGDKLIDAETGRESGIARREYNGSLWRVFASINLPDPGKGRAYHGWLSDPLTDRSLYIGEFFPVQDGYSVTYTTEDDVRFYTHVALTEEDVNELPQQLSQPVATWQFRDEVAHQQVSPTPESTPVIEEPEPTPELSPEPTENTPDPTPEATPIAAPEAQ